MRISEGALHSLTEFYMEDFRMFEYSPSPPPGLFIVSAKQLT